MDYPSPKKAEAQRKMPLRASLFLPAATCPSLNILSGPGCSASKLKGKNLFGTNSEYTVRSEKQGSEHVVATKKNPDTRVQGSRHKCSCPVLSKILLSKWEAPTEPWSGAASGNEQTLLNQSNHLRARIVPM